ncbi:MAG: HAMP domain-containing histidine kinase [Campylobacteraceae bacterium]|nr:HAMP domain-containing histidine kinase [Campylobacteraceae bacterium]
MLNIIDKFRNSIGSNLFNRVYLTYFVFVFIFVLFQIFTEYKNEKKKIEKVFTKIETVYKSILIKNIKEKNIKELNNISNAIEETTDVAGISIIESKQRFIYLHGIVSSDIENIKSIIRIPNLEYTFSDDLLTHGIGFNINNREYFIFLFIEENEIYKNMEESIFLILLNILASMIVLGILFLIFSTKHLIKPLNKIIDATKKFDVVEHEVIEIKLESTEKNELHTLARTFNKMSKRINEAYINMQQLTMIREIQKNKLEEQKKELVDANKSKDDFMANMSHELKTPLNSINVISNVMMKNKRGVLNEKDIKNLEIINKCGKDLLFLINDVLDLSKLEAGEIILNNDKLDIRELSDSIYDMFNLQVKERNIEFTYHIDDSLDYIFSDKDRISQIVKNLLSNAVKFTEKGQVKFLVLDEDPNIKVVIEDDGIGISKDKLEHIFDRFKQVDGSTTRKYGGTGLGLAICKELSKLLEGDVFVESEVDKGSRFTLVLPKNKHLLEGMNLLEITANNEKSHDANQAKEDIIVLNNDPIVFFNLVIELNKNYKVLQAFSFDELKTFIERKEKMIVDIDSLPKDEIEFLVANFEGKLIFISENELEEKYKTEVFDFVKKPLTEELIAKI